MHRSVLHPSTALTRQEYNALLEFCAVWTSKILLVVRQWNELRPAGKAILRELSTDRVEASETPEWPGTVLLGHTARVYKFPISARTISVLKNSRNGLFDWLEPEFPEDLCFLRSDDTPLFVSITHERQAYFELTAPERSALKETVPNLVLTPNFYMV